MNERIRELAEQAGGHYGEGLEFAVVFGELEDFEKFAELIVRECISTIESAENGYKDYRNQIEDGMRDHCISLIKHKFGVE